MTKTGTSIRWSCSSFVQRYQNLQLALLRNNLSFRPRDFMTFYSSIQISLNMSYMVVQCWWMTSSYLQFMLQQAPVCTRRFCLPVCCLQTQILFGEYKWLLKQLACAQMLMTKGVNWIREDIRTAKFESNKVHKRLSMVWTTCTMANSLFNYKEGMIVFHLWQRLN